VDHQPDFYDGFINSPQAPTQLCIFHILWHDSLKTKNTVEQTPQINGNWALQKQLVGSFSIVQTKISSVGQLKSSVVKVILS